MLKSYYIRPILGWLAGCIAATLVIPLLGMAKLAIAAASSDHFPNVFAVVLFYGFLLSFVIIPTVFILVCVLSGIPAVILICMSEMLRMRFSMFFGGGGGAVIGGLSQFLLSLAFVQLPSLSPLFLVAGFAGGLAYWFVAGKYAGGDTIVPYPTH
jgi:hypothetical protein